jgi:hypothetical protein
MSWGLVVVPGTAVPQKVQFMVEPDGKFHTYEVDLSGSPAYRGQIRRLRFEVGARGQFVDVEFISVQKQ